MTRRLICVLPIVLGCGKVSSNADAAVADDRPPIDSPLACGPTTCASGCCDEQGMCREAPACGTAGAACLAGCPLTRPEASNLILWLVGDDFDPTSTTWPDRSGRGADASCAAANLSCPGSAAINGHKDVRFAGGANGFALTDPAMAFKSQSWTFLLVVKPDTSGASYDQLLAFYVGGQYVKFQRDNTSANIAFQVIPGGGPPNYLLTGASYGWTGNWERIFGSVDVTGFAKLGVYNNTASVNSLVSGSIGTPNSVDYSTSYVGTTPTNPGTTSYVGEIAEIIVFDAQLSDLTQQALQSYLTARYGL